MNIARYKKNGAVNISSTVRTLIGSLITKGQSVHKNYVFWCIETSKDINLVESKELVTADNQIGKDQIVSVLSSEYESLGHGYYYWPTLEQRIKGQF